MRLADILHILVRLTVMDFCGIATVTVMADTIVRLTDIRVKTRGYADIEHPIMDPLFKRKKLTKISKCKEVVINSKGEYDLSSRLYFASCFQKGDTDK